MICNVTYPPGFATAAKVEAGASMKNVLVLANSDTKNNVISGSINSEEEDGFQTYSKVRFLVYFSEKKNCRLTYMLLIIIKGRNESLKRFSDLTNAICPLRQIKGGKLEIVNNFNLQTVQQ